MSRWRPWLAGWALLSACGTTADPKAFEAYDDDSAVVSDSADSASPLPEFTSADFASAESCGSCHPVHFDEWRQSMHAYAAQSPVFDAMTAKAYRDSAGEIGDFCAACHAPLGRIDGDPGFLTAAERGPKALEGITCVVCHQATHHNGIVGNEGIVLDPDTPLQGPFADASTAGHPVGTDALTTTSELCGSCHDVFLFPSLRIEEAYTEFLESPAARDGQRCQDCHMSPTPGVPSDRDIGPIAVDPMGRVTWPDRARSSHRFVGPDYSLIDTFPPTADPAADRAAALERTAELLRAAVALDDVQTTTATGVTDLRLSLVNLTTGHRVPTGFTSERQLWVAVEGRRADGTLCYQTGDLDRLGDLRDQHAATVQSGERELDVDLVNLQSKNIQLERFYEASGEYDPDSFPVVGEATFPFEANHIEKHSLEPLERRAVRYRIPCGAGSVLTLTLRYRNLPPYVLRALNQAHLVDRLQVFDLDQVVVEVR
jgi:hypothetical protein